MLHTRKLDRRRRRGLTRRQRKLQRLREERKAELARWAEFGRIMEQFENTCDHITDQLGQLGFMLKYGAEAERRGIKLVPHGFHGG